MSDAQSDFAGSTRGPLSSAAALAEEHNRIVTEINDAGLEAAKRVRALEEENARLKRHYDAAGPEHDLLGLLDLYFERVEEAEDDRDMARLALEDARAACKRLRIERDNLRMRLEPIRREVSEHATRALELSKALDAMNERQRLEWSRAETAEGRIIYLEEQVRGLAEGVCIANVARDAARRDAEGLRAAANDARLFCRGMSVRSRGYVANLLETALQRSNDGRNP